jgi:hypothetical protein
MKQQLLLFSCALADIRPCAILSFFLQFKNRRCSLPYIETQISTQKDATNGTGLQQLHGTGF